jgi:coenzyme F420 biosynthesis associated uncharacterized protein
VDWALAARTASRLMAPGPAISQFDARRAVELLRSNAAVAEGHVREVTGLGAGLPLLPADVVDRPSWVQAATSGMAALTGNAVLPAVPATARRITATTAGLQVGAVLSYLGTRVLGQYDPFGADGRGKLLLVAPNVVAVQRTLDVALEDFTLWVCLHEATHRLQFTAVPWLRGYFAGQVGEFLSTSEQTVAGMLERLPELISSARGGKDGLGLLEVLQSPEQRAVLDRLLALTTLLEGHADHVMDAVGPSVVPSVQTIRARFSERRRGGGLLDRLLRALLGVEAKVRQYAVGAAFTEAVIDEVGMDGFNKVWGSPGTLPTRAELADPNVWVRRIRA